MFKLRRALVASTGIAVTAAALAVPGFSASAAAAPSTEAAVASAAKAAVGTAAKKAPRSNLSELRKYGFPVTKMSTLFSPAQRKGAYLTFRPNMSVDFSATKVTQDNQLAFLPAKTSRKNTVNILASAYSEGKYAHCLTNTRKDKLILSVCRAGNKAQEFRITWQGDSGLFAVTGKYGQLKFNGGKATTGAKGYNGFLAFGPRGG